MNFRRLAPLVISFATGFIAILLIAFLCAMALSVVADQADWNSHALALGPLTVIGLTSTASTTSFSVGPGAVVAAAVLAGINTLSGAALGRRDGGRPMESSGNR